MKKQGISLIVLGITIITLVTLSGAVLLVSAPSNPVKEARQKTYKTDLINISNSLAEKIGNLEQNQGIDGDRIYMYEYEADEYLPKLPEKYKGKLGIEAGKLVVLKIDAEGLEIDAETKKWAEDAGFKVIPPYYKPPIPIGYTAISKQTDWNSGFTIIDEYKNEFVWVPALSLKKEYMNGRQFLDPEDANYDKCFGTRDYSHIPDLMKRYKLYNGLDKIQIDDSRSYGIGVPVSEKVEYPKMVEDVEEKGGFYVSKYEMGDDGRSVKYQDDYGGIGVSIIHSTAISQAAWFQSIHPNVNFSVMTASHYDTMLAWILSSGAKTREQVEASSRSIGNFYYDSLEYKPNATSTTMMIKNKNKAQYIPIGSSEKTYINGIADLAGNYEEVVQGRVIGGEFGGYWLARGSWVGEKSTANMNLVNMSTPDPTRKDYVTRVVLIFND